MRILAIDYGLSRTGVAVSDPTGLIASPLPHVPSKHFQPLLDGVSAYIDQYSPELIIIGMPCRTDGGESPMTEKVKNFAEALGQLTDKPIRFVNEMYTTVIASRMLHANEKKAKQQKQIIDSAAAAVLLQGYIDGLKNV